MLTDPRRASGTPPANVYRFTHAVRALIAEGDGHRLTELPAGSVFYQTKLDPDANGMIEGASNDSSVLIFLNDLEERSERMNIRIPAASVRIIPEVSQS